MHLYVSKQIEEMEELKKSRRLKKELDSRSLSKLVTVIKKNIYGNENKKKNDSILIKNK